MQERAAGSPTQNLPNAWAAGEDRLLEARARDLMKTSRPHREHDRVQRHLKLDVPWGAKPLNVFRLLPKHCVPAAPHKLDSETLPQVSRLVVSELRPVEVLELELTSGLDEAGPLPPRSECSPGRENRAAAGPPRRRTEAGGPTARPTVAPFARRTHPSAGCHSAFPP